MGLGEAEVDCDPHDHGSCSPTKFDSGQGSEGSTGSHHSSQVRDGIEIFGNFTCLIHEH